MFTLPPYTIPKGFTLFKNSLDLVTTQARADLEQLKEQHIFLTGCTSFFGKWLIECLLWANRHYHMKIRISLLTRNANRFLKNMPHLTAHSNLHIITGDATNLERVNIEPFQFAIQAVNVLNDGSPTWSTRHMRTAVNASEEIIRFARQHGCKTVLLLSSGAVYGTQREQQLPYSESNLTITLDEPAIYGNTKRFLEFFVRALGREAGMQVPIARLFTFAGAYTPLMERTALGNFISCMLRKESLVITGDGTSLRTYLHARDMIVWTLAVLVRGGNTVYNIGSEYPVSIRELASIVLNCAGRPITDLTVLGKFIQGNAPSSYVPNTDIAHSLGLEETSTLQESIQEMLAWYQMVKSPIHNSI